MAVNPMPEARIPSARPRLLVNQLTTALLHAIDTPPPISAIANTIAYRDAMLLIKLKPATQTANHAIEKIATFLAPMRSITQPANGDAIASPPNRQRLHRPSADLVIGSNQCIASLV